MPDNARTALLHQLQQLRWEAWKGMDIFVQRPRTYQQFQAIARMADGVIDTFIRQPTDEPRVPPRWLRWLNRTFG